MPVRGMFCTPERVVCHSSQGALRTTDGLGDRRRKLDRIELGRRSTQTDCNYAVHAVSEQNMHGEHAFNTYKTRHVPQYAECLLRELGGREAKI